MAKSLSIIELTLDEMMADPIVRLTMRRDAVSERDLRALLDTVATGLAARAAHIR